MKLTSLLQLSFFFALILFCGTACEDDTERISTQEEVIIEGDNNAVEIRMNRTNWNITSITTLDGWSPIVDENNNPLKLEGMGTARFRWGSLTRDKEDALTIQTEENLEDVERGFIIFLGTDTGFYKEQIIVRQKPGDKYELKSIVYSLEDDDGEANNGARPYGANVSNMSSRPSTFGVFPYSNMPEEYEFSCPDNLAFYLLKGEAPLVDAPEIVDGKIQLTGMKVKFSYYLHEYDSKLKDTVIEVELAPMKLTKIRLNVSYKWNRMTYTATLANVRTKQEKVIKGKLIKTFPEFHTPPQLEVCDLEEK